MIGCGQFRRLAFAFAGGRSLSRTMLLDDLTVLSLGLFARVRVLLARASAAPSGKSSSPEEKEKFDVKKSGRSIRTLSDSCCRLPWPTGLLRARRRQLVTDSGTSLHGAGSRLLELRRGRG